MPPNIPHTAKGRLKHTHRNLYHIEVIDFSGIQPLKNILKKRWYFIASAIIQASYSTPAHRIRSRAHKRHAQCFQQHRNVGTLGILHRR